MILTLVGCAPQPDDRRGSTTPPASNGASAATPPATATPAWQRGEGGDLKILYWQAPTTLNPHQATSTSDIDASRLVLEPLAALDPDGTPVAQLAAGIPTQQNGGVSADLTTVTWRLKQGVLWSDGSPFSSVDVVLTYKYMCDPSSGTTSFGACHNVTSVTAPDPNTVVVQYSAPQTFPYQWGVGRDTPILQWRQYKDCVGEAAKSCDADQDPVGTGPYKIREFKVGDVVLYDANENFRDPDKPFFKSVSFMGGGDPMSAALAVFQTGDVDYAWNLRVEPSVLEEMASGSDKAALVVEYGASVERLLLNRADPDPALGDRRSEPETQHPFFRDKAVRRALSMATDREAVAELYGLAALPTCNVLTAPERMRSLSTASLDLCTFDLQAAERELDRAGWVKGADGVRSKNGVRLEILYQTAESAPHLRTQEIMKANWEKVGFRVTLRSEPGATFLTNASPGGAPKFYADVQQLAKGPGAPDAVSYLESWTCAEVNGSAKDWNGKGWERYCDPGYDRIIDQLRREMDVARRDALAIRANDHLVEDVVVIPLVRTSSAIAGVSKDLKGVMPSGWDSEMWNIADWYR
ncbi:MAG: peptide ABC transporter substrate-binding protein [Candidatus Limnocylindria bacterium]